MNFTDEKSLEEKIAELSNGSNFFVDIDSNLVDPVFAADLDAVVQRAKDAGKNKIR